MSVRQAPSGFEDVVRVLKDRGASDFLEVRRWRWCVKTDLHDDRVRRVRDNQAEDLAFRATLAPDGVLEGRRVEGDQAKPTRHYSDLLQLFDAHAARAS